MKKVFTLALIFVSTIAHSQLLTWSPQFPTDASTINITMNAALGNQGFLNYTDTGYMHLGVITNLSTNPSDWRYVTTVWASIFSPLSPGGLTPIATHVGGNTWTFSITNPRAYFNVPAGETILEIALLFRNGAGDTIERNADGGDLKVPIYAAGSNNIIFTVPTLVPEDYPISNTLITGVIGQSVTVKALASTSGTLNLYFNGTSIATPVTGTVIAGSGTPTANGLQHFVAELTVGSVSTYDTISFYITPPTVVAALPSAVVINGVPHEGINYYGCSDSVTLVLYAPYKKSSVLIGDFAGSNWYSQPQYQMYKGAGADSSYFWITIHGLTSGTQYAFQYLVDNLYYIADPYSEEVLDGANDPYIPASTYPNLKPYPTNSNVTTNKNGLIGVLETCAPQYTWKVKNFTPPAKQDLLIEEVLVRDFADSNGAGNFALLTDSINYFKRLGINAIELMPVADFSGNDSWGYNPNFTSALAKAYGTKTMYKTFIDSCHANGIAVIMDVCYNQIDDNGIQVPEARLYWDTANSAPAANNPWLNQAAPHPYSVFDDINHTSTASQYWVERSLNYWLTEYHVDGFRFDLAKGFTQNCTNGVNLQCPNGDNSNSSENSVEDYDATRVQNLERYYNFVQTNHPGSTMPYMILEFLSANDPSTEEQAYVNYGFMVWNEIGSNGTPTQTSWDQNTMGYASNSNLSAAMYNSSEKVFSSPGSVDYMASHDDQRPMYTTENYGNGAAVKSVSGVGGALQRQAAAAAILFLAPGPHMFYEFDERGNDTSQNADGGNTNYKNPLWYYLTTDANAAARRACVNAYSQLINFRVSNPAVFNNTTFTYDLYDGGGLVRLIQMSDPSGTGLSVTVMANFDITADSYTVNFQKTGTWYNYLSDATSTGLNGATGTTFNLTATSQNITLQPGEYHVYVYQPPTTYTFIGNGNWTTASNWMCGSVPPNPLPSGSQITIDPSPGGQCILNTSVPQVISSGATFTVDANKTLSIPLNLVIEQ